MLIPGGASEAAWSWHRAIIEHLQSELVLIYQLLRGVSGSGAACLRSRRTIARECVDVAVM
ncbi:hypothetical protein KL86DES1_21837 [uncultured Desulfovibrio sp.]|uniref:Uncharacterized protein n=1 Tax=uncultured Desulfovibrio sp. TaxID=167968 RepID=A0A212L9M3_9BACT|nr:hypothetical protein KL86DES1_21835 [uncultured Desulfovibrio sp.]SCM74271.1 hypothetical protein KL86DES1_21837 [uncultured Desulfovibrio sp.]VZH34736.1 conserved protein of unknown function [Desulfovibrio sp. 86]